MEIECIHFSLYALLLFLLFFSFLFLGDGWMILSNKSTNKLMTLDIRYMGFFSSLYVSLFVAF